MSQPKSETELLHEYSDYLLDIIGALVEQLDGHTTLTREEIEDAPELHVKQLFDMDILELKTRKES
jgi:hypothetical protein